MLPMGETIQRGGKSVGDTRTVLTIADTSASEPVAAPWAGALIALGARLARHADSLVDRQLIVVLSAPRRDYVACLVGAGWTLTRPVDLQARRGLELFRNISQGTWCRAITQGEIHVGAFGALEEDRKLPRVIFADAMFHANAFDFAIEVDPQDKPRHQKRSIPGSVARLSGADQRWAERLIQPPQDLAMVGIETRLNADMDAVVSWNGAGDGDLLRDLLMPQRHESATWFSKTYSSAKIEFVPEEFNAVILDGRGAIQLVSEVFAPVVVCVVDRSLADEAPIERLVNMRLVEGSRVSASNELGWQPPRGIEVMAFEVPL